MNLAFMLPLSARSYSLLSLLLILPLAPAAAQNDSLTNLLNQLITELKDVDTEKYRYEQALEYDADNPWRVVVSITEINLKNDKAANTKFYLNLADLQAKLVTIETDKDEQTLLLKCSRRQNFIRQTDEDGEVDYTSEFQIWSPEIDRANVLRDLFKEAIKVATTAWEKNFSPGSTLEELDEWLTNNLIAVDAAGQTITPKWTSAHPLTDLITLEVIDSEEEAAHSYSFSLGDLARKSLQLEIRKGRVSVEVQTVNRASLILHKEGETVEGYERDLSIPVNGIEEAGRLIQVLEAIIPLATKLREARMPAPKSLDEALQLAAELVTGANRGTEEITATLSPTPLAELELKTDDLDKGASSSERSLFDFGDLNTAKIELRVKGLNLDVIAETKRGEDFVQRWEDGEDEGFEDEVVFPINDVETARKLEVLLPYIISEAAKIPVPVADFSWLAAAIEEASTEDVTQKTEQREGPCKWSYQATMEGKKSEEVLYEFNLYDLDVKRLSYAVTSKGVFLKIPSLRKEEVINVFENGEPKFTNEIIIKLKSLQAAKQAKATLEKLIDDCEE